MGGVTLFYRQWVIPTTAKLNRTARRTEALIFKMTRRLLKILLSTSFIIAVFSQYSKVFAVDGGGATMDKYGYFDVNIPEKYVFSYVIAFGSRTGFGVGVNPPLKPLLTVV